MNAQIISCTCIGIVGILFIILSVPFFLKQKRLEKNCSNKIVGKVIKYKFLGSNNARSISPVVKYTIDGKEYTAYRHYKKIVSTNKYVLNTNEMLGEKDSFYILDDVFYINTKGFYHNYKSLAEKNWPIQSELTVLYNPKNPKQGFVEKVVTISRTIGMVFLFVGLLFIILSVTSYFLFTL